METNRKSVIVCGFVVLLCLGGNAWAAHAYAYASVSDGGANGANGSDNDWGFGQATASISVSCTCNPFCGGIAQTTSRAYVSNGVIHEEAGTANNIVVAGHDYTNTGTADYDAIVFIACLQGAIANCELAIDPGTSICLPQSDMANRASIDIAIIAGDSTVASGYFSLAGNGTTSGSGIYETSNFDVTLENDMWTAEYNGPETVQVELPANTYFNLSFKTVSDCNIPEPLPADANEPGYVIQDVSLAFPATSEVIMVDPNSLVAHLKLDDLHIHTTCDDSPGRFFPGTLNEDQGQGSPTWTIGKMGSAIRFEGDQGTTGQYLTITEPNLPVLESFTIAFWMKPDDMAPDQAKAIILERGDNAGKGFLISKEQQSNGEMHFQIGSGDPNTTIIVEYMYEPNEWVHIAWTFDSDSGTQKVYKDGQLEQSDSVTSGTADAPGLIRLGKSIISQPQRQYNGLLDNFQIFNYVLSEEEIAQLLCSEPIPGDLNSDCKENLLDFSIFAADWLKCNLLVQNLCSN